jgi:hypothetical protein
VDGAEGYTDRVLPWEERCLGVELLDENRLLVASNQQELLSNYRINCPSGFGDGSNQLKLDHLTRALASWPEWRANAGEWLARFRGAMDTFESFLETIPLVWLPTPRKRLMIALLDARLTSLESLV